MNNRFKSGDLVFSGSKIVMFLKYCFQDGKVEILPGKNPSKTLSTRYQNNEVSFVLYGNGTLGAVWTSYLRAMDVPKNPQ